MLKQDEKVDLQKDLFNMITRSNKFFGNLYKENSTTSMGVNNGTGDKDLLAKKPPEVISEQIKKGDAI